MLNIYTIGFTKKTAEQFFGLLCSTDAKHLIDTRLNNKSQLGRFTVRVDLEYFTRELTSLIYHEMPILAPTDSLLKQYRNKQISWLGYARAYNRLIHKRNVAEGIERFLRPMFVEGVVLLCSEHAADKCHRRLAAEYIKQTILPQAQIVHL